ncbi:MAG: protein translocase subunit SecF [Vicinamibacteria bacterium]
MDILRDTNINWLKYRWHFIAVSIILLVVGGIDIYRKGGLRYGIDFSEGTIVYAKFESAPQIDTIRQALANSGLGEAIIQRYDQPELNQVMIRVEREAQQAGDLDTTANQILSTLEERYRENPLVDSSTEIVGPVVGQELRRKAVNATILALVAMLIYIGLRFEFIYGVGATIAVIHDVLVTLGLVSIFGYDISLNVIAAFLTLVGYSVNDTIVIFDRVRENRRFLRRKPLDEIINLSINQTLRRTILTSGTTFITVVSLFLLGGEVLRSFAFVLVAGLIVGTYSTIAIASVIVSWWRRAREKRSPEEAKAQARAANA